jgi:N-acylneuraminate cytidylyltransferase
MKHASVLAIIPARGGSRGIPRKNLKDLGGMPLLAHSIRHAQKADLVTDYLVNSEDAEIREVAASFGAPVMNRPPEYAEEIMPNEVDLLLGWTVKEFERNHEPVDIVVLLYPTSPLRDPKSIDEAILRITRDGYDSVLSLYFDDRYLWAREGHSVVPTNYDPTRRMPRQKESWNQWVENKAVYAVRRDRLIETGCRLGGKIGFVEMEKWRSIDVDAPEDLELVRTLYDLRIASRT